MLKNVSRLECKVDNRDFVFYCDPDSPLTTVKEALFQFQKYVGQIEDAAKKAKEEQEKQAEVKECEEVCTPLE